MKKMFVAASLLLAVCAACAQTDVLPAEAAQMRGTLYKELGKLAKEYNAALLPMAARVKR